MRNLILKNIILNILTIFFLIFSYQISYSELKSKENYKLNITNVNISSFPNIKVNIYFRKLPFYAEDSLLTSNFTIKENNIIISSLSLERLTHTTNIALVLDVDLAFGIYSSYGEKIIKIISNYMENLDKFAIFTFAPEICIFNFDENKKNISMNNFVPDYSHKIEEIINYSIDKLNATTGKKHVIYVALKPANINEEIIVDKLKTLNNDEQIFIHILKFNIENFMDNVFFGLAASYITSCTNGRYYEITLKDYEEILNNLMMFIKSNYKLEYVSPQPFFNGRKRQIEVSAYFNEKIYYDQISYGVSFNMPELNFNINDNPVVYQELDPNTLKLADKLGITLSSNIKFLNNNSNQVNALAIVGFGAFDINGYPIKDEQYVLLVNNLFMVSACNQYVSNKNEYLQLLNLNKNNQNDEKIIVNYLEDNFFQKNLKNKFMKKAGIYWTPHFKNKNFNQWVRCFNSFFPKSLKLDGTIRYAVYLSGLSLTSQNSDICFDGIQLQYGLSPTIYTENKTIFFGPEDITKSMIEPLNPRIEYQMK